MGFGDAVKHCFSNYVNFNGRAGKNEFWYFFALVVGVNVLFNALSQAASIIGLIGTLWSLGTLLPFLAVGARRLHDVGKTGWLQLTWLCAPVGLIVMIIFGIKDGDAASNQYGDPVGGAPAAPEGDA